MSAPNTLIKDVNSVAVAGGVSDLDGVTILPLKIDHITGRLLVSATGGGTSLTVTDGVHTVTSTSTISFTSGATVTDLGGGIAGVAISGGGGTPSAPDTSIQFNDAGSFGGADLLYTHPGYPFIQPAGVTSADGTELDISAGDANGDSTTGGDLFMYGGAGHNATGGSPAGGLLWMKGGQSDGTGGGFELQAASGQTADGGAVSLQSGRGQGGDFNGGNISLLADTGSGDGNGGDIILKPGDYPGGSGRSGFVQVGPNGISNQGKMSLYSLNDMNIFGAAFTIQATDNHGSSAGTFDAMALESSSTHTSGDGTLDTIFGIDLKALGSSGDGTTTNLKGILIGVHGQTGPVTNAYGLYIESVTGATNKWAIKTGAGKVELGDTLKLDDVSSGIGAILDTSLLSSSDKTFSFPNASGTLAVSGSGNIALDATSGNITFTGQLPVANGGTGATTLLGAGVIAKTSTVALTAQTADIGSTNLTTTGAGLYRASYYLLDSVADLTAGAVKVAFTYTDNGAAQTVNSSTVLLTTLGTYTQGSVIIQLASGNIAYSTTHTGIFGSSKYDIFITLERLN